MSYIVCLKLGKMFCASKWKFSTKFLTAYITCLILRTASATRFFLRRYTPPINAVLFIKSLKARFLLYVIIIPSSKLPFCYVRECFSKTNWNDFPQEVNTWSFLWYSHLDLLAFHISEHYLLFTPVERFEHRICLRSTQWPGTSVSVGG